MVVEGVRDLLRAVVEVWADLAEVVEHISGQRLAVYFGAHFVLPVTEGVSPGLDLERGGKSWELAVATDSGDVP